MLHPRGAHVYAVCTAFWPALCVAHETSVCCRSATTHTEQLVPRAGHCTARTADYVSFTLTPARTKRRPLAHFGQRQVEELTKDNARRSQA